MLPLSSCEDSSVSIEFLITTLVIVATPGTGVLYTLAAGLSRGAHASIIAAVGCTLGIVPHMLAAITGLATLLHTSAVAFQSLKYLGVVYLLYLAWNTLREKGALAAAEQKAPRSALKVITSGVLINILNPKLTIFFFAFLPQFVSSSESKRSPAHAPIERRLHARDLRRLRHLRRVCRRHPPPRHLQRPRHGLDAPWFRRLLCSPASLRSPSADAAAHRQPSSTPAGRSSAPSAR